MSMPKQTIATTTVIAVLLLTPLWEPTAPISVRQFPLPI